jgi:MFS family permease
MSLLIDVSPLRVPAYRRVWIGNGLSFLGFNVTAVAVAQQMWQLTRSSAWVGYIQLATFLPLLVFGLWGGAAADVFDRRRLLLASSLVAWVATIVLVTQGGSGTPVVLLGIVAVQSAAFAVSSPTRHSVVARIVPPELIPAANTLSFTTMTLGVVVGSLVFGGIVLAFGDHALTVAYLVDAVLFTVSLWATWRLPPLPRLDATARPSVGLRGVADGLRFLTTRPVLLSSFGIDLVAMVFAMPVALFPELAATRFGGPVALAWLNASIALGALLGGLLSGWVGRVRRQGLALIAAVVAWGLAVGLAGLAPWLWLVVVLLVAAGSADLASSVFRQSILQTHVPDELRGRLQGINTVVIAAELLGTQLAFAGGGFLAAGLAVVLGFTFPALARYRRATR